MRSHCRYCGHHHAVEALCRRPTRRAFVSLCGLALGGVSAGLSGLSLRNAPNLPIEYSVFERIEIEAPAKVTWDLTFDEASRLKLGDTVRVATVWGGDGGRAEYRVQRIVPLSATSARVILG